MSVAPTGRVAATAASAARTALVVAAVAYVLLFVGIALWRLRHPFELEWMEGAMVDHVDRVLAGDPIYAAPSLAFTAFIYPPGYYYASAAVALLVGPGFLALRLVSFIASLGILALLYRWVARETGDRLAAAASTGLFAATYALGGAFLDLGRVDSLCLVLLLAALYVLRFGESMGAYAAAGVLLALAVLTKQSAAVMAAPAVLVAMYRRPRHGLAAVAVAAAIALGATTLLEVSSNGWYRFYTLHIPSGYAIEPSRLVGFWRYDVLPPLAIAWALGLLYFAAPPARSPRVFHAAVVAGALAGAWMSRGNPGGYDNVLIPAFLAACLLFGFGLHSARTLIAALPPLRASRAHAWLGAVCLLQLALLAYDPRYPLPTRADARAGREFVAAMAAVDGDVWIPHHGHITAMAGKPVHAHWMAVSDVLNHGGDSLRSAMQARVDSAVRARRFAVIVQSTHPFLDAPPLEAFYVAAGDAVPDDGTLWPTTGAPRRVQTIYRPR